MSDKHAPAKSFKQDTEAIATNQDGILNDSDSMESEEDIMALIRQLTERSLRQHEKERAKVRAEFLRKMNEIKARTTEIFHDSERNDARREQLVRLSELLDKRDQITQALQQNAVNLATILNKAQRSLHVALTTRAKSLQRLEQCLEPEIAA